MATLPTAVEPPRASPSARRATGLLLASAASLTLLLAFLPRAGVPSDAMLAVSDVAQLVAAATAAAFAFLAARRLSGAPRVAWALFALGAASWALGQVVWMRYELVLGVDAPIPSVADAGYYPYYALAAAAILVLAYPSRSSASAPAGTFVDALLVTSTLFTVAWTAFLDDVFANAPDSLAAWVSAGYSMAGILVLALILAAFLRGTNTLRAGLGWIGAATLLIGFADTSLALGVFAGEYQTGELGDAGWVAGFLVLAAAAARATGARVELARPRRVVAALPLASITIALGAWLLMRPWHPGPPDPVTTTGWTVVTFLALARSGLFAREHLRASQQLADALAHSAQREAVLSETQRVGRIGSWEVDLKTGALRFSPETTRIVGLTTQDAPTLRAGISRLHPDDQPLFERMIEEATRSGSSSGEARLPRPDGATTWLSFQLQSRKDAGGRPAGIIGTVQDVSERKNAEVALHEKSALLAEAQSVGRVGSWSVDLATGVMTVSEQALGLAGLPHAGNLSIDAAARLLHPEDRERTVKMVQDAAQNGFASTEARFPAPEGTVRWAAFRAEVRRDASGRPVRVTGTIQDITELKVAQLEAERRATLQSGLRDVASLALNVPDLALLLQLVATKVARTTGNEVVEVLELDANERTLTTRATVGLPEELVGAHSTANAATTLAGYAIDHAPHVILAGDGDDPRFAPSPLLHEQGIQSSAAVAIVTRSGAYGVLNTHSRQARASRGVDADFLQGVASILANAVDRNRTESALRRNERLSSLGTLVAGVAHEINNPLMYIHGSVELIQQSAKDLAVGLDVQHAAIAGTIREDADMALRGLDRISVITKGLRQVARPPGGERTVESMNAIITGILPIARPRMGANVDVELDLQSHATARCNANEISQVVLNLLFNAADAMARKGGTIRVTTRDADDHILVDVADQGEGIPPEKRAHIFTPFYTTKASGTGLGLSVSHGIIAEHEGELTFDSTLGLGTTFHIKLPAARRSPADAPQTVTP